MPLDTWQFDAVNEADTERLGAALGRALLPGTIVGLVGDLGAGKTRLVQATAQAMGVERRGVSSPTFMLIHEYAGRLPIYHVDTYRLGSGDEFLELGADELFDSEGVCLIEWADRVTELLPADRLTIEIEITGPSSRRFRIHAAGPISDAVLTQLQNFLAE